VHSQKAAYPTSWLDGLRGFAALFVFFCHLTFSYLDKVRFVYGTQLPAGSIMGNGQFIHAGDPLPGPVAIHSNGDPAQNNWFIQLPGVRLLFYGHPMVAIFFVVSGYALSAKPIRLMRRGVAAQGQLLQTLASATFRRPARLLLPCIVSTLFIVVATRLGVYDYANRVATGEKVFRSNFRGWAWEPPPHVFKTLYAQLKDWKHETYGMMNFFTHYHWAKSSYDNHLWTIPVEFRCSLFLFLTLAGTALLRPRMRLSLVCIFIILSYTWGDIWEMGLFWTGMFLCELDIISAEKTSSMARPGILSGNGSVIQQLRKLKLRWVLVVMLSLYLLSYPEVYPELSNLYYYLSKIHYPGLRDSEQFRVPQCVGAALLVLAVSRCQMFKSFFSSSLARYLGRISYALYLVHGPIIRSLGFSLSHVIFLRLNGGDKDITALSSGWYLFGAVVSNLTLIPVVIWAADLFNRAVDEPIVKLAKWIEGLVVEKAA